MHKADVRVYTKGNAVYACSTYFGRRVRLESGVKLIDLYARAGHSTFAYAIGDMFGSVSLKTGKRLRRFVATKYPFFEKPDAVLVKGDGSIAYIYTGNYGDTHSEGNTVGKADKTGPSTLDSDCILCSNHIDTTSLRIVGNTVRWKDTGVLTSAPFK